MPAPWAPDLGVYPAQIDHRPAVVTVDLGAIAHGPVATHPVWVGLRTPLQHPLANGLPSTHEAQALNALHDRLEAELVDAADALFAVRYVTAGCLFLIYYVPPAPDRRPNLTEGYEPYRPELSATEDPEWSTLLDTFAPDEWQRQLMANGRLLEKLRSLGDAPTAKRNVDHTIVLAAGPVPPALLERLRESGYTIDSVHQHPDDAVVNFSRVEDLTDDVALISCPFDLAREFHGRYDGRAGHPRLSTAQSSTTAPAGGRRATTVDASRSDLPLSPIARAGPASGGFRTPSLRRPSARRLSLTVAPT